MSSKQSDSVEQRKCDNCGEFGECCQKQEQSTECVGEPVAWVRRHPDGAFTAEFLEDAVIEPVRKTSGAWFPLYTTPPQQRKPLTDEQIRKASLEAGMQEHYMDFHSGFIRFAKAIEAAHGIHPSDFKEKNT